MKTQNQTNLPSESELNDLRADIAAHPNRVRRVMSALVAQPWAIKPDMLDLMVEITEEHAAGIRRDFPKRTQATEDTEIVNGVAIVPVMGVLMNRASGFQRISGATSPQAIASQFESAMSDPNVAAVILHVNSPGGQVAGVAEAADRIWEAKQGNPRPVYAFAEGTMASGAYWIGSQADAIYSTPTSVIGSIGVVSKLVDSSRREKNAGEDSVIIKTGSKKAVGVGPITEDQIADMKAMADEYFTMFKEAVTRGRGKELSAEILSGKVFTASQAKSQGILLDGIGTLDGVIKLLQKNA